MKRLAVITGTSRGIGRELAAAFLAEGFFVLGISRTRVDTELDPVYSNSNFEAIQMDLAEMDFSRLGLDRFTAYEEQLLILNAGQLGEIAPVRAWKDPQVASFFSVNVSSNILLTAYFLSSFTHSNTIIYISSGAARRAIASWSLYCASKAATEHFLECLSLEEAELGRDTRVYSVAPGVVDTEMQREIRTSTGHFSDRDRYRDLFSENKLLCPAKVAQKMVELYRMKNCKKVSLRIEEIEISPF